MRFYLVILFIFSIVNPPLSLAQSREIAFEIVMDDSGVLTDAAEAEKYKLSMLGHLKALNNIRRFSQARIDVISTAYGRSMWIGSPRDLNSPRAAELLDYIQPKLDQCNNLEGAFKALEANLEQLERQGYKEVYVLVFSSLIDTPRPCNGVVNLKLPQLPPPLDLNAILTDRESLKAVNFFWVNPHQRAVWNEFLSPSIDHSSQNGIPFGLFDIENTRFELEVGIQGVSR